MNIYANYTHGTGFVIYNLAIEGPGPNGWWVCSASIDLAPISAEHTFRIMVDQNKSGGLAYPGDGTSFVQVFQPSLTEDGGQNLLVSPDDLTDPAWAAVGASVVNVPDDVLPAP